MELCWKTLIPILGKSISALDPSASCLAPLQCSTKCKGRRGMHIPPRQRQVSKIPSSLSSKSAADQIMP